MQMQNMSKDYRETFIYFKSSGKSCICNEKDLDLRKVEKAVYQAMEDFHYKEWLQLSYSLLRKSRVTPTGINGYRMPHSKKEKSLKKTSKRYGRDNEQLNQGPFSAKKWVRNVKGSRSRLGKTRQISGLNKRTSKSIWKSIILWHKK